MLRAPQSGVISAFAAARFVSVIEAINRASNMHFNPGQRVNSGENNGKNGAKKGKIPFT